MLEGLDYKRCVGACVCMHLCVYVHVCACMLVCARVLVCLCVHVRSCMRVCDPQLLGSKGGDHSGQGRSRPLAGTYRRWESRGAAAGRSRPARTGCGSSSCTCHSRDRWCCVHTRTAGCPRAWSTGWRAGCTCTWGDMGGTDVSKLMGRPARPLGKGEPYQEGQGKLLGLAWRGLWRPPVQPATIFLRTKKVPNLPPVEGTPPSPVLSQHEGCPGHCCWAAVLFDGGFKGFLQLGRGGVTRCPCPRCCIFSNATSDHLRS